MELTKEQEHKIMEDYDDFCKEEEAKEIKKYNICIDYIKKIKSKEFIELLEEEIQQSEGGTNFRFVNEPVGTPDDSNIIGVWVNQTTNGGYTGDNFAGTVCVKIKEDKYIIWDYEM